jgi:hypothetical protein
MHSHLKTIKVLGEVDVSHYVDLFSDIDDLDWMDEFSTFSKKYIPFFRELDRLPLMYCVGGKYEGVYDTLEDAVKDFDIGNDIIKFLNSGNPNNDVQIKGKFYEKYYDEKFFNDINNLLSKELGEGKFMMFMFNLMNPHSKIDPHADQRTADKKRIHIPIITHPDIKLYNGGDEIHMEAGKVYMIDHTIEHSVVNPTDCERIHLVIDWKLDADY